MTDSNSDDRIDRWRTARKNPVEVEFRGPYRDPDVVETLEGDYEIDEEYINRHDGFVIIRGVDDERYPCALDVFRQSYELPDCDSDGGDDIEEPFLYRWARTVAFFGAVGSSLAVLLFFAAGQYGLAVLFGLLAVYFVYCLRTGLIDHGGSDD